MTYARRQTRPKPRKSDLKAFTAPIGGWVSNRALANPYEPGVRQGAAVLDNFFPTASVVRMRRGRERFVTLPDNAGAMLSYSSGNNEHLFAATASTIYDITAGTAVSAVTGNTSADWSAVQFATTGGVFLVGVNGADPGFIYDGLSFSVPSISFGTGITLANMSHVWTYKNRLWFAQRDSMTAWYLPVDSIGGSATALPLGGIFGKGGKLLFGQAWSLDNGESGGLSEQNIFCSSQGEVAIFQGSDPSSASDWQKVGVYRIGTPLGKNAFLRGGGDLAIATTVGLVPLSKAISLDITSLNVATISYNIADAWSEAVNNRGASDWCCEIWPEQKMAFISPPDLIGASAPVAFVSNTETGAWCRFTNWRMLCMEVFRGGLYFGSADGAVYLANKGGVDDGFPYTGIVMPLFEDVGAPAALKVGKMGRTTLRSFAPTGVVTQMHVDFNSTINSMPDALMAGVPNIWGTGVWGSSVWGSITPELLSQEWQSVSGAGYAITVSCQITSGSEAPLDAEIIRQELTYTTGEMLS